MIISKNFENIGQEVNILSVGTLRLLYPEKTIKGRSR